MGAKKPIRWPRRQESQNHLSNQRGSALVEVAVAVPVLIMVFGLGFYLLYLSFAKAWITRSVREAAVCLVTPATKSECRRRLEKTLESALLVGQIEISEFRLGPSESHVEVSLDANPQLLIRVSNSAPRTD